MSSQRDERLPRTIEPTHYRVQLIPNFEKLTTSGVVRITLLIKEKTNKIIFNINDIEIEAQSLKITSTKNSKLIPILSQDYVEGYRYKVKLDRELKKNDEYYLDIVFNGELNRHLQGFYKMSYTDENGVVRCGASTQFSPTDARRAFPCFDEPYFKAQFTISIARPSEMITLSNMPLEKSDIMVGNANWVWDHYPITPKMPTYIVGFMVVNLETKSSLKNLIRIWSRAALLGQTAYANELAPKILGFLEKYFTIKFPLSKIDFVAVPEFGFSAMENWGLITFRESVLLFSEGTSSFENKQRTALVMGHEIAHQWFGNLVTPKTWNDLWLKEGFATYFEYLSVNHAEPNWHILDDFIQSETSRAFKVDALPSARPISANLINCQQIRETFDEISYAKGACLVRMMHHFLGEAFRSGLINLLKKFEYGNIDCDDLFKCLTLEANRCGVLKSCGSVNNVMDTWTKQAGFPVLTVSMDYVHCNLTLTQRRFFFTSSKADDSTWWIPVSATTDINPNFDDTLPLFWVKGEKQAVSNKIKAREWYLLNVNQTGYYIVNYDEKNWKALINNITKFPPLIRTQLISDSLDLSRANLLNYDIPLTLIKTMAANNILPSIGDSKLKFLTDILLNTPAYKYIQDFPYPSRKKRTTLSDPECDNKCRCSVCVFCKKSLAELIDEDSTIRVQDAQDVFTSLAKQKSYLAFAFLRENWLKMQERYGDGFNILARMITSLSPYMNKESELKELITFKNSVKENLSTTAQAFDIAIQTVKGNVEWMENNYETVERWLRENKCT